MDALKLGVEVGVIAKTASWWIIHVFAFPFVCSDIKSSLVSR